MAETATSTDFPRPNFAAPMAIADAAGTRMPRLAS
jgi:hypothetical protein